MRKFTMRQVFLFVLSLLSTAALSSAACVSTSSNPGCVHFEWNTSANNDLYTYAPGIPQQQWFQEHMYRIMGYQNYWNYRLNWFPKSWFYQDSSSLYKGSDIVAQHPEWILTNQYGTKLFINWGCAFGTCAQYVPDYSNEAFRQWWIEQARRQFNQGFIGIFVDDVNLVMNLTNGVTQDTPIDNNTGAPMTQQAWERYFADFLTEIRNAFPNAEICHNALWYAGNFSPKNDPYVAQEVKAANYINVERGFADTGLTNAGGWSIQNLFAYADAVHALGSNILAEQYGFDGQFSLASYLLVNDGKDLFTNDSVTPANWPAMYDVDLGSALGARRLWNGLIRRDFAEGMVLVNPPGSRPVKVPLPGTFTDLNGQQVTSVTLNGREAAVLYGKVQNNGPIPDGTYVLTNLYSQLAMDDANQSRQEGNQMIQWSANGGANQQWNFSWNGAGYYTIQNALSGLYLTSGAVQNTALTQQAFSSSDTQLWSLKLYGQVYAVINKATGFAIDDPSFSKQQGTGLIMWAPNVGQNQAWYIK